VSIKSGTLHHVQAAKLLGLAQEIADRLTREAKAEADEMLSKARTPSEQLLCQARVKADGMVNEARTLPVVFAELALAI
jgi:cell division septum initiation protein DivIVA